MEFRSAHKGYRVAAPLSPRWHMEQRSHTFELADTFAGMRLDQALAKALPQYSRARLKGWIEAGAVHVDGRVPKPRDAVRGGEQISIEAVVEPESAVNPEKIPLDIVFKDRALFVINKPAGLVVHPGAGNATHTMQNALLSLDPRLAVVPRSGIVHRLDKDTSGLLVVARTLEAHTALAAALAARDVKREYIAICNGVLTGGGTVDQPIGRHRSVRTRMAIRADGREAVTHYRIGKRYKAHTLVNVELETGRTHQIRVHLAHIGHSIVGDTVYGGRRRVPRGASAKLIEALDAFKRQALHAARLSVDHPSTGRPMEWEAPLPQDMTALLVALETDQKSAMR
jgi:23S rRNA pseudouridine1911/1915/1917 synthase